MVTVGCEALERDLRAMNKSDTQYVMAYADLYLIVLESIREYARYAEGRTTGGHSIVAEALANRAAEQMASVGKSVGDGVIPVYCDRERMRMHVYDAVRHVSSAHHVGSLTRPIAALMADDAVDRISKDVCPPPAGMAMEECDDNVRIVVINMMARLARECGAKNDAVNHWLTSRTDFIGGVEELAEIVRSSVGCSVHYGGVHGGEAEELRKGIETIMESMPDGSESVRGELIGLLDRVDSLAYLERADLQAPISSDVLKAISEELNETTYEPVRLSADEIRQLEHHVKDCRATCSYTCSVIDRVIAANRNTKPAVPHVFTEEERHALQIAHAAVVKTTAMLRENGTPGHTVEFGSGTLQIIERMIFGSPL